MFTALNNPYQEITPQSDKCLVTIAIGDGYFDKWTRVSRGSLEQYAAKHGYDVIAIAAPLDGSALAQSRSPAWQKCLILSQMPLERHFDT